MKGYYTSMPERLTGCLDRYDPKCPSAIEGYIHKRDRSRRKIAIPLSKDVVTEIKNLVLQAIEFHKYDPRPAIIFRQITDVSKIANVDPEDVGLAWWELQTEGITNSRGKFEYTDNKPPTF